MVTCWDRPSTYTVKCYIKFGAVRPAPTAGERFDRLLDACERLATAQGLWHLDAGMDLARHEAYRQMLARGFHTTIQGVAMQRLNDPGYYWPDVYVIDDWRQTQRQVRDQLLAEPWRHLPAYDPSRNTILSQAELVEAPARCAWRLTVKIARAVGSALVTVEGLVIGSSRPAPELRIGTPLTHPDSPLGLFGFSAPYPAVGVGFRRPSLGADTHQPQLAAQLLL